MRPRRNNKRTSRSRRDKNNLAISSNVKAGLIVTVPVLLIVFGLFWLKWSTSQFEYDQDLCLRNQPLTDHTILVIDMTDNMQGMHAKFLKAIIERTKNNLQPFAKFSIYVIDHNFGGFARKAFSLCNPGTAATTDIFMQAPKQVQTRFEQKFEKPLNNLRKSLSVTSSADSSPIIETVQKISELSLFSPNIPHRKLILYSDMLQNSTLFSHYDPAWQKKSRRLIASSPTDLDGVSVDVHYFTRIPERQTAEHRAFWKLYFETIGATYSFFQIN